MRKYTLIPYFDTKFRIGKSDWHDSDDMIHSDTLFSAIVNCYNLLFGNEKTDQFIRAFKAGNISLSSVWYSIHIKNKINETGKYIDFFPKPYNIKPPQKQQDTPIHPAKRAKNIHYVSRETLNHILSMYDATTGTFAVDLTNTNEFHHIGNEFVYTPDEFGYTFTSTKNIKKQETETKNKIDRRTSGVMQENGLGQLFREIDLLLQCIEDKEYIAEPCMFFLAEIPESFQMNFDAAVRLMGDEGLGGERSFGKGTFKGVEISAYDDFTNKTNNHQPFVLLSLLNPKDETERFKKSLIGYDSILRGGWSWNVQKKNVRMVREGSVFTEKINGSLVDVTPNNHKGRHPIYQNGIGFYV